MFILLDAALICVLGSAEAEEALYTALEELAARLSAVPQTASNHGIGSGPTTSVTPPVPRPSSTRSKGSASSPSGLAASTSPLPPTGAAPGQPTAPAPRLGRPKPTDSDREEGVEASHGTSDGSSSLLSVPLTYSGPDGVVVHFSSSDSAGAGGSQP